MNRNESDSKGTRQGEKAQRARLDLRQSSRQERKDVEVERCGAVAGHVGRALQRSNSASINFIFVTPAPSPTSQTVRLSLLDSFRDL